MKEPQFDRGHSAKGGLRTHKHALRCFISTGLTQRRDTKAPSLSTGAPSRMTRMRKVSGVDTHQMVIDNESLRFSVPREGMQGLQTRRNLQGRSPGEDRIRTRTKARTVPTLLARQGLYLHSLRRTAAGTGRTDPQPCTR